MNSHSAASLRILSTASRSRRKSSATWRDLWPTRTEWSERLRDRCRAWESSTLISKTKGSRYFATPADWPMRGMKKLMTSVKNFENYNFRETIKNFFGRSFLFFYRWLQIEYFLKTSLRASSSSIGVNTKQKYLTEISYCDYRQTSWRSRPRILDHFHVPPYKRRWVNKNVQIRAKIESTIEDAQRTRKELDLMEGSIKNKRSPSKCSRRC